MGTLNVTITNFLAGTENEIEEVRKKERERKKE